MAALTSYGVGNKVGGSPKSRIIFNDPKQPIEIFCKDKYMGYFIRGQILNVREKIYDSHFPKGYADVSYNITVLILLSESYFTDRDENPTICMDYPGFGDFYGRTKEEFINIQKENSRSTYPTLKDIHNKHVKANKPLEVKLEQLEIKNTLQLLQSIKKKKNTILLYLGIIYDSCGDGKTPQAVLEQKYHLDKIHVLPYYLKSFDRIIEDGTPSNRDLSIIFDHVHHTVYNILKHRTLSKNDCNSLIGDIAELGLRWADAEGKVSSRYLKILVAFNDKSRKHPEPYYEFYSSFFNDLVADLNAKEKIWQCLACGNIYKYKKGRKYCSLTGEGKNCSRKYYSKSYYKKNQWKIRPKAKVAMRETRALYKDKGVEK